MYREIAGIEPVICGVCDEDSGNFAAAADRFLEQVKTFGDAEAALSEYALRGGAADRLYQWIFRARKSLVLIADRVFSEGPE